MESGRLISILFFIVSILPSSSPSFVDGFLGLTFFAMSSKWLVETREQVKMVHV